MGLQRTPCCRYTTPEVLPTLTARHAPVPAQNVTGRRAAATVRAAMGSLIKKRRKRMRKKKHKKLLKKTRWQRRQQGK